MSVKILLKRSDVAGKIPQTTDLDIGEIAINLADKLIYTKRINPDTSQEEIITIGGGGGTDVDCDFVSHLFTATAGQTTFTISGGYEPNDIAVFVNGIKQVNGEDVDVSSGTDIVFSQGLNDGDKVEAITNACTGTGVSIVTGEVFDKISYVASGGETTVTVDHIQNYVDVIKNGVTLELNEDYTSDGSQITFTNALAANDRIIIYVWKRVVLDGIEAPQNPRVTKFVSNNYTANAGELVTCLQGNITITLPDSPNDGAEVVVMDATGNAQTNNITIQPSGTNTINNGDTSLICDVNNFDIRIVYYQGDWKLGGLA